MYKQVLSKEGVWISLSNCRCTYSILSYCDSQWIHCVNIWYDDHGFYSSSRPFVFFNTSNQMSKPNCKLHVTIKKETGNQKDVIAEVRFYHKAINGTLIYVDSSSYNYIKLPEKTPIAWRMKIMFL